MYISPSVGVDGSVLRGQQQQEQVVQVCGTQHGQPVGHAHVDGDSHVVVADSSDATSPTASALL